MKAGDCFKAGLHIGIGFVGIGLVIGLMLDSIGPAAKAMAENFDLNLHVVDVGWPGSSPMTRASQIALVAIPIAILVNVAMLLTRMTRVVNVDIWNIWHMTFLKRVAASGNRFMDDRDGRCGNSRGVCL